MNDGRDGPESLTVTLLVCTHNRSRDLRDLLETALAQEADDSYSYEVLIVDNNSDDDTRRVVETLMMSGHPNLRYLFQERPRADALNAGLEAARGVIVSVVGDDCLLPSDWVKKLVVAFREHPDVSVIGSKVLPMWQGTVPSWLGRQHWSALALTDYGDTPFSVDAQHKASLLYCSILRADAQAVGSFRSVPNVSSEPIGGVDDVDILERLWLAGKRGLYLPAIVMRHKVNVGRLTKSYHRRWHTEHGRFYAVMRNASFEQAGVRLFDAPAHVYRQTGRAALGWMKSWMRREPDLAFMCETQLRFCLGFLRERRRDFKARGGRVSGVELASFVRTLLTDRRRRP
jgi:glycosyltransferase involved in cell wall biosynthesis